MNYAYHELTEEQRRECYERGSFVEEIYNDNITWKPQHEVELHLKYSGYSRGRSSILFYWKDENGLKYPMFVKDFDDILSNKNINTFDFHAIFSFVKRGANYGIKYLKDVTKEN